MVQFSSEIQVSMSIRQRFMNYMLIYLKVVYGCFVAIAELSGKKKDFSSFLARSQSMKSHEL